jgi:hypothetical protein
MVLMNFLNSICVVEDMESRVVHYTKYYESVQVKGSEMGGACNTHERWKMFTKFWLEKLKGGDHSEDLA